MKGVFTEIDFDLNFTFFQYSDDKKHEENLFNSILVDLKLKLRVGKFFMDSLMVI